MVFVIAAVAKAGDRAICKALFDFKSLGLAEPNFHRMGMLGAELYAEHTRLLTVGDQGGQVPILGPLVGDEAKAEVSGRSSTPSKVRKQGCTESGDSGLLQEAPSGKVFWVHPLK